MDINMPVRRRKWAAFWVSVVSGVLIGVGIYLLTNDVLVAVVLGLGLYAPNYFICVGLTSTANDLYRFMEKFDDLASKEEHARLFPIDRP